MAGKEQDTLGPMQIRALKRIAGEQVYWHNTSQAWLSRVPGSISANVMTGLCRRGLVDLRGSGPRLTAKGEAAIKDLT